MHGKPLREVPISSWSPVVIKACALGVKLPNNYHLSQNSPTKLAGLDWN